MSIANRQLQYKRDFPGWDRNEEQRNQSYIKNYTVLLANQPQSTMCFASQNRLGYRKTDSDMKLRASKAHSIYIHNILKLLFQLASDHEC
jgi:hypothetical protein